MNYDLRNIAKYDLRNIFLEKLCTKCGGETSPRPFFKKLQLSISLDQQFQVSHSLLLLYVQVEDY